MFIKFSYFYYIYFRPTPEDIVLSREIAEDFIKENFPSHTIKSVPGDGYCIIHAFREGLNSIGRTESFENITSTLRIELSNDRYKNCLSDSHHMDLLNQFEHYLKNPLAYYDKDITDLFLDALGMAYKVNIIVFRSDRTNCYILDQSNPANSFEHTLHFVRTESEHVDPVLPINRISGYEISDSDDSIVITGVTEGSGEVEMKNEVQIIKPDIHEEIPEPINSHPTIFEEFPEPIDIEENEPEQEITLFNFSNPSAEDLFHQILIDPKKHEVNVPLKACRSNRIYTVKDCKLSNITCDDNGAYTKNNTVNSFFYVNYDENGINDVKTVHKNKDRFYYNKKMSRQYDKVPVSDKHVYRLTRYYRISKAFPSLKMMVVSLSSVSPPEYVYPYWCVIYSLSAALDEDDFLTCTPHGNSKQTSVFAKPYIRTNPVVLSRIDELIDEDNQSAVFDRLLEESGGPFSSFSPSFEPRNISQIANRKSSKKRKTSTSIPTVPTTQPSNLDMLMAAQRDPTSPVRTVLVFRDAYIAFLYTDKQIDDIKRFCCDPTDNNTCVLGIDTTFKLCNMWVTDTSYRNKRLLSIRTKKNPVHLGPVMLHFTKDEETFRRFCLELIASCPDLANLKKIGVDMEAAIFKGFKSVIMNLLKLYCVRHLQKRDEVSLLDMLKKKSDDKKKEQIKMEILSDLYGQRLNNLFQKGIADSTDKDDFEAKLLSLKPRWEKICPGFFGWFEKNRKADFISSVIVSAREGTNVEGLYYSNDIESLHAVEKRMQSFRVGTVLEAVNTINSLVKREENEELLALYGAGNYVLSQQYKNWFAPMWHSWSPERRQRYAKNFRLAQPTIESTFVKPANPGRKPGYKKRVRITSTPDDVIDRVSSAVPVPTVASDPPVASDSPVASSQTLTHVQTETPFTPVESSVDFQTGDHISSTPITISAHNISFEDPRQIPEMVFELHLRDQLPKSITKCRGHCGQAIKINDRLLVKSYGNSTWRDPKTHEEMSRYGAMYIHFKDECLKAYDSSTYYAPNENFNYEKIKLSQKSKEKLSSDDLDYLRNMKIM